MSSNSEIVDLTADTEQNSAQSSQPKKRLLPASVMPTTTIPVNTQYVAPRVSVPQISSYIQPKPGSFSHRAPVTTQVPGIRTLPPSVLGASLPASTSQYAKPAQYQLPNAKIVFSIVNSKYFTARAEVGTVQPNLLSTFDKIPGAKFDWQACRWLFPLSCHDALHVSLATYHKHLVEPLPRYTIAAAQLKNQRDEQNSSNRIGDSKGNGVESLLALKGHIPDKVLHQLAPFQREAVQFVMGNKGRAMIADEMGLGKTRTAISAAMAYRDDWPVLIVSPSSARHHWQAEILNVLHPEFIDPKDISVVESSAHPIHKGAHNFKAKVLIVSYHLVAKITEILLSIPFNVVIVDESHYMKNSSAQRTKMLMPLLHKAKRAFLLSGTPALSRPIELFTQLHAIAPKAWPHEKDFGRRYCIMSKAEKKARQAASGASASKSWAEFSGASNIEELHMMLTATIMIRRLKNDILTQLPPKERHVVKVDIQDPAKKAEMVGMLSLAAEYEEKLAAQKKSRLQGPARVQELEELAELRAKKKHILMNLFTMSGEAKLPAILKHMDTFLDNPLSGKLLVFCHHRSVMDGLARALAQRGQECIRIDGQTPSKERHSRVQHFQSSSHCRVAILAITAAGIALTLTAASTVYFAELFWTPASLLQAEDRAHRIGQSSTVKVTYFLANGTVDELLWPMVRQKMKLLGEIVEGSKELDFMASMEDNETEAFPSAAVGTKRSIGSVSLSKDEMGDIANEIAADLRATSKGPPSSSSSGKRGKDTSEDSEEEEEEAAAIAAAAAAEEEVAVVAIDEPDQLALLYMKMYNGRGRGPVLQRPASMGSMAVNAAPSYLPNTMGVASSSSSQLSTVSLLSPVKSENAGCISLISPADEELWARQGAASVTNGNGSSSSSSSGRTGNGSGATWYQPGEVVDLFDDDDDEKGEEREKEQTYAGSSTSTSGDYASSSKEGGIALPESEASHAGLMEAYNLGWIPSEVSSGANQTGLFDYVSDPHFFSSPNLATGSSYEDVVSYTIDEGEECLPEQEGACEELSSSTKLVEADGSPHASQSASYLASTPAPIAQIASVVYSPATPALGCSVSPFPSQRELIVQAQQAWSSAAASHQPKSNRPVGKFTPSLKKNDSTNSLKKVEENIQAIKVTTSSVSLSALKETHGAVDTGDQCPVTVVVSKDSEDYPLSVRADNGP